MNMQMSLDIGDTNWTKPAIFIVQNLRDDGLAAYETAFHEMGHAMDYTHRRSQEVTGPAYGYVETHSIFMERFMEDMEFLKAVGRNANGERISQDLLNAYVQESVIGRFMNFRQGNAFNSLYDLEVWNFAYDENSEDLVERMLKLSREMTDKYSPFKEEVIEGVDQAYGMFATDHFYSGSVRYIGYLYADIAADMVYRSTIKRLIGQTGRASLYRQPKLGPLLKSNFYELGAMTKFPQVIEEATDIPFSAEAQAARFNQAVITYLQGPRSLGLTPDTCARLLN
jgi:Zn-dependent oligopeptidase